MSFWRAHVVWFDADAEDIEIEADSIEEAARKLYEEWAPTGWTEGAVYGPDYAISVDLEASEFNATRF